MQEQQLLACFVIFQIKFSRPVKTRNLTSTSQSMHFLFCVAQGQLNAAAERDLHLHSPPTSPQAVQGFQLATFQSQAPLTYQQKIKNG